MRRRGEQTKLRLIDAANRLFYAYGVRGVGVDAVAEKAGVTKRTLYHHFRSKDDLVAAYVDARRRPNLDAFARWYGDAEGDAAAKTRALFAGLASAARHPRWRGCGFIRTVGELAETPGHPAVAAASAHKKDVEDWLVGRFVAAGCGDPRRVALHVALLIDGAFAAAMTHQDAGYIEAAGDAAAAVVAADANGL